MICPRYVDSNGLARVCGGADLKASQYYPRLFGHAVAQLYESHAKEIKYEVKTQLRLVFIDGGTNGWGYMGGPWVPSNKSLAPFPSPGKSFQPWRGLALEWRTASEMDWMWVIQMATNTLKINTCIDIHICLIAKGIYIICIAIFMYRYVKISKGICIYLYINIFICIYICIYNM